MARYDYTREVYTDPMPGRDDAEILESNPCVRCGGDVRAFSEYDRINGGDCFECGSDPSYLDHYTVADARKAEARRVKSINATRLEMAKEELRWDADIADAADVRSEWGTLVRGEGVLSSEYAESYWFLQSIVDRMLKGKGLSAKQIEAGANSIARFNNRHQIEADRAAKKAATPAVVSGRQEIAGTVKSHKEVDGDYGLSWKMIVEDDEGRRYYGTIPQSIFEALSALGYGYNLDELPGKRVTLTGTVKPSDDHDFGFYSRPAKARISE